MLVVVPVDPPREGLVCRSLVDDPDVPIDASEAVDLYEAAVADVLRAVDDSGGDCLVNYRDEETLPGFASGDDVAAGDAESDVERLVDDALGETGDVRLERQVGSTRSARVGNTATHLLESEGVRSVGVVAPTAAVLRRPDVDGAAMSLRRRDLLLGPAERDRTWLAGFRTAIDFDGAFDPPELSTLATRGADAGLDVGFAPRVPTIETEAGLCATIAAIDAHEASGAAVGRETAAVVDDLGLELVADRDDGEAESMDPQGASITR